MTAGSELAMHLALGLSALLTAGVLGVALVRTPLLRHRLAELSLAGSLLVTLLLVAPIERPLAGWSLGASTITDAPSTRASSSGLPAGAKLAMDGADAASTLAGWANGSPRGDNASAWGAAIWLVALWLAGAALVSLRLAVSIAALGRLVRSAQPVPVSALQDLAGGGDEVRVLHSEQVRRPLCCGWRRGVILIPTNLLSDERRAQRRAVLLHERAHLSMGHGRSRWIAALAAPLLFWNPLYWLHAAVLRRDAELLADEDASRTLGAHGYASELLALAENQLAALRVQTSRWSPGVGLFGVGLFGAPEPFYRRMRQLLERDAPLSTRCTRAQRLGTLTAALLTVAGISSAIGRAPEKPRATGGSELRVDTLQDLARRAREIDATGQPLTRLRAALSAEGHYEVSLELDRTDH